MLARATSASAGGCVALTLRRKRRCVTADLSALGTASWCVAPMAGSTSTTASYTVQHASQGSPYASTDLESASREVSLEIKSYIVRRYRRQRKYGDIPIPAG